MRIGEAHHHAPAKPGARTEVVVDGGGDLVVSLVERDVEGTVLERQPSIGVVPSSPGWYQLLLS